MKPSTNACISFLSPLSLLLALTGAAVLAAGCKTQGGGQPAKGDSESCAKYASALCDIAGGETSPTCSSVKATAELMAPAACATGLATLDVSKSRYADARKVCSDLAEKLCKDIDQDPETCKMVREQTERFPIDRCRQMSGNYDQVLTSVKQLAERNKPLPPEKMAKLLEGDVPSFGPKNAKVAVVEFSDFQCPFCSRAATAINELKKKYADRVRFVFRQFPLSFHQQAHGAAQAALAAHAQGKFWEFHDILFENQSALQEADLEKHAQKAGLQMALFKKAMKEKTYAAQVDADLAMGNEVAVSGTPTVFVNGKRVGNATSAEELSKVIEAELAAAGG